MLSPCCIVKGKMGISSSSDIGAEELDEYSELLYLKKSEILHLYRRFKEIGHEVGIDRKTRYDLVRIGLEFPELKSNPFVDRILAVFSSEKDEKMSFEDMLDFYSVLNEKCPTRVKAIYAFKLFDFDGDGQLNKADIVEIIERLITSGKSRLTAVNLLQEDKDSIAEHILSDLDLDKTGGVTVSEFAHAVMKMPDFFNSFKLKV